MISPVNVFSLGAAKLREIRTNIAKKVPAIFFIVGCLRKTELTVFVEREDTQDRREVTGFLIVTITPRTGGACASVFVCLLASNAHPKLDRKGRGRSKLGDCVITGDSSVFPVTLSPLDESSS